MKTQRQPRQKIVLSIIGVLVFGLAIFMPSARAADPPAPSPTVEEKGSPPSGDVQERGMPRMGLGSRVPVLPGRNSVSNLTDGECASLTNCKIVNDPGCPAVGGGYHHRCACSDGSSACIDKASPQ
jgi:hypothetical protein